MEQKPENSVPKTESQNPFPKPPVLPIDMSKVSPDMLKTADSVTGIPISALPQYFSDLEAYHQGIEARMNVILDVLQHFDEGVKTSVGKMIKDPPTAFVPPAGAAGGQSNMMAGIMQSLPQLMQMFGGTAGSDPFTEMAKTVMMESFKESLSFNKAFQQAILSKLGGKMTDQVVESVAVAVK
jgi:hypothetical protein